MGTDEPIGPTATDWAMGRKTEAPGYAADMVGTVAAPRGTKLGR